MTQRNLYYAITKEVSITLHSEDGYSAKEYDKIGAYFCAESRGKAKSMLIQYAKSEGARVEFTDIESVTLIAKNVDGDAGIVDFDYTHPAHPDYHLYMEAKYIGV